jgi:hypothetical protein
LSFIVLIGFLSRALDALRHREYCDVKGWEQPVISSLGADGVPPQKKAGAESAVGAEAAGVLEGGAGAAAGLNEPLMGEALVGCQEEGQKEGHWQGQEVGQEEVRAASVAEGMVMQGLGALSL